VKVHLLSPSADADRPAHAPDPLPEHVQDLDLDTLLDAMGGGDPFVRHVAQAVLLSPSSDITVLRWRQQVAADVHTHRDTIEALTELATAAGEAEKHIPGWFWGKHPTAVLGRSEQVLQALIGHLRALRDTATTTVDTWASPGLRDFMTRTRVTLPDEYLLEMSETLTLMRFPDGVVMTAGVGPAATTTGHVLRLPQPRPWSWRRMLGTPEPGELTYHLADRDESGERALTELRDRGQALVAEALAEAAEHITDFFHQLRWELSFYLAVDNLVRRLDAAGTGSCYPTLAPAESMRIHVAGIYDPCLVLHGATDVVPNDVDNDGRPILLISGSNQGGKSTLLRALGLSQLLTQVGMPVPAHHATLSVRSQIHTHFQREEDSHLTSGKLDEEMSRMSDIVDRLTPGALVLFNESFASTNEREGSQIARVIIDGLVRAGIGVMYVTHLHALASGLARERGPQTRFLVPERLADGRRTFRLLPGHPEDSSHALDVYDKVFHEPADASPPPTAAATQARHSGTAT
jgi:hypothetical protein